MVFLAFFLIVIALIWIATNLVLGAKRFGKAPSGGRLQRILQSPNYRDGRFQNISPTPQISENTSMFTVLMNFLFAKSPDKIPSEIFHFEKTSLKNIPIEENAYVWMGHSSYFLQTDGRKFLADPVFSGYASPFSFSTKAFKGADLYTAEDIPALDYLIITHDHWDHLDYQTVTKLFPKVKNIITGLGTGAHLEFWGCDPEKIIELDWYESADLGDGFQVFAEPTRHFSGRGFKRDQAIWASFVLKTPLHTLYFGGDSGYDSHFKKIGEKFGGIDLAILENGQYNDAWKYIHMLPGEQLRAMEDLGAKYMIPVHNSKFALAMHPWKEPLEQLKNRNVGGFPIFYPKIGEKIFWDNAPENRRPWWESFD